MEVSEQSCGQGRVGKLRCSQGFLETEPMFKDPEILLGGADHGSGGRSSSRPT